MVYAHLARNSTLNWLPNSGPWVSVPSKADPNVWMRDKGDHWEYLCVYVDDLMAIMKDPDKFFEELSKHYKLKGLGPPKYHLGGDFFRDKDGTFGWGAQTYIQKMLVNYEIMFGSHPKEFTAPLDSY